jgi:hypothetical protein
MDQFHLPFGTLDDGELPANARNKIGSSPACGSSEDRQNRRASLFFGGEPLLNREILNTHGFHAATMQ